MRVIEDGRLFLRTIAPCFGASSPNPESRISCSHVPFDERTLHRKGQSMIQKILVVDDEQIIRESISYILRKEGYSVMEAGTGG